MEGKSMLIRAFILHLVNVPTDWNPADPRLQGPMGSCSEGGGFFSSSAFR